MLQGLGAGSGLGLTSFIPELREWRLRLLGISQLSQLWLGSRSKAMLLVKLV